MGLVTKVACLWIYTLNWVLTNFPYKLLWTIMDSLWTVVITQTQSIVGQKRFTVTIIKLLQIKLFACVYLFEIIVRLYKLNK